MTLPNLTDIGPSIPQAFVEDISGRPAEPHIDGDSWLAALPRTVRELADQWSLVADGQVRHGACAIVIPVRQGDRPAALKVAWPHAEADHEHLALRAWHGDGAVRLLAAEPHATGLLLERLDADRDLREVSILDACETIGTLMGRLDRPALPQLRTLAAESPRWAEQLGTGHRAVPRRFTDQAATLLPHLTDGHAARLVHSDLHFENVLAGEREPWLAIDPKPVAAPWEYAVAPVLWNREADLARATNPRAHLRLRLGLVADAAGLDEELARRWSFVRVVLNAVWAVEFLPDSHDFISRMLTVAKAMSD